MDENNKKDIRNTDLSGSDEESRQEQEQMGPILAEDRRIIAEIEKMREEESASHHWTVQEVEENLQES